MVVDRLEARLRELDVAAPDAGRVSARVLGRQARQTRRGFPRLVTVPVALALLVALIAYFVPAADLAVADKAPWSGELLQWAGLVGARDHITAVNSSATSSGYRLTLTGAYADSKRTVLLMHAEPAIEFPTLPTITDQFARTYRTSGGSSNMLTGDFDIEFEPLAWPDSMTGARITLHIAQLETPSHEVVNGTWDVTAALPVEEARSMRAPAPGDLGPAHFRFLSVSYTTASIEVDIEVTGASPEDLSRIVPNGAKGQPALYIEVIDESGQVVGGGFGGPNPISVTGFRTAGSRYLIRVSYYGYGSFDRTLTIPS